MSAAPAQLPSKFISVHSLSAAKGQVYTCVICNSEGSFLCTQCQSCYCCREHLLLDDLACHALLCDRQAAIREILKLPLATRTRPEIASKLSVLRDECRKVAYLESRRHVLEGNNELALPAAERSLQFARDVHGDESIELVPPLLALADVACLAGAQSAARGYSSRASWLLLGREQELRNLVEHALRPRVCRATEQIYSVIAPGEQKQVRCAYSYEKSNVGTSLTRTFGRGFSGAVVKRRPPRRLGRVEGGEAGAGVGAGAGAGGEGEAGVGSPAGPSAGPQAGQSPQPGQPGQPGQDDLRASQASASRASRASLQLDRSAARLSLSQLGGEGEGEGAGARAGAGAEPQGEGAAAVVSPGVSPGASGTNAKAPLGSSLGASLRASRGPSKLGEEEMAMLNQQVQDDVADETFRTPQGLALAKLVSRYWATEMRLCATEDRFPEALSAAAAACYFSSLSYGVYSVQTALHIYSISKLLMLQGGADPAVTTSAMLEGQRTLLKTILAYYAPYVIGVQAYCHDNHLEVTDELLTRFKAEFVRSERLREEGERLSFQADIKEAIQHLVFSMDHIERHFGEGSPEFTECCLETALCLEVVEDPGRQGYVAKAWEALRLNGEGGQDPALVQAFRMALPGQGA